MNYGNTYDHHEGISSAECPRCTTLEQQRDELLTLLKYARGFLHHRVVIAEIDAAIKRIEGGE